MARASATAATATGTAGGAIPRPRAVVVCPLARCGKLTVRPTREAAREADRAHWSRVHASEVSR